MPTIILFFFFVTFYTGSREPTISELTTSYKTISKIYGERFLCCDTNANRNGDYSWTTSYILNADLLMFQSTGDTLYSNRFIRIATKIINNRDDRLGIQDWSGTEGAGWSEYQHWDPLTGKNTTGIPMRYLVDDAVILKPLLDFAIYVRQNSLTQFDSISKIFIDEATQVMDQQIHDSWSVSRGYFIFPKGSPVWCDGVNIPLNQASVAGTVLMLLYSQTGNELYRILVQQIADSLKMSLRSFNGLYQWNYWGGLGDRGWNETDSISVNTPRYHGHRTIDDIGHAALVVEFITECVTHRIAFTRTDIDKLIMTFKEQIDQGDFFLNSLDQNSAKISTRTEIPAYKWILLAKYDGSIAKSISEKYLTTALQYGGSGNAYLIASLVAHYSSIKK